MANPEQFLLTLTENARQPWQFTGAGFVIGLLIVVADQLLTKKPSINVSMQCRLIYCGIT